MRDQVLELQAGFTGRDLLMALSELSGDVLAGQVVVVRSDRPRVGAALCDVDVESGEIVEEVSRPRTAPRVVLGLFTPTITVETQPPPGDAALAAAEVDPL